MAIKDIPSTPLLPSTWAQTNALGANMNATNPKRALWFYAPKAGNITHIWVMVGTVTTAQPMKASLQTLNANYDPSGVTVAGSTFSATVTPSGGIGYWMAIGNAAVAVGDLNACVVEWDSTAGSTSLTYAPGGLGNQAIIYVSSSSTWSRGGTSVGAFAIRYSDGTEYPVGNPVKAYNVQSFQNGSTYNERGNRFRLPYSARLSGWWYFGQAGGGVPFSFNLYDANDNLLFSRSYNSNMVQGTSQFNRFEFDATYTLTADTWYRAAVKNSSTTGNWNTREVAFVSAALAATVEGGANFYSTYRGNSAGWIDDITTKHLIVPTINGIDPESSGTSTSAGSIFGSSIISAGGRTT